MGAWGVQPFSSDGALDWLGHSITTPLAKTIKEALERFLSYKKEERSVRLLDPRPVPLRKKKPRFNRKSMKALMKSHREVQLVGRQSNHDQAEPAAALLDELTSYGTRWRLINYVKWGESMKMVQKKVEQRGLIYCSRINSAVSGPWKKGKPPTVLPENHRLVFGSSKDNIRIRLNYEAEHMELYSLAVRAIREVMDDDAYLSSWRNGSEKRAALRPLLQSLELKAFTEVHAAEKKIVDSVSFRRASMRLRAKRANKASKRKKGSKKAS